MIDNSLNDTIMLGVEQSIATEQQGIELLYRARSIADVPFTDVSEFNTHCAELDVYSLVTEHSWSKQFDIPLHYQQLDPVQYVWSRVPPNSDRSIHERVEQELGMFTARNLQPVLQLLIYIVETMRTHNLVWGVGRGSSTASYVLYLIGIHKIDSIRYQLDIREFLK
jgi:DNA polymerase III alpha subunit